LQFELITSCIHFAIIENSVGFRFKCSLLEPSANTNKYDVLSCEDCTTCCFLAPMVPRVGAKFGWDRSVWLISAETSNHKRSHAFFSGYLWTETLHYFQWFYMILLISEYLNIFVLGSGRSYMILLHDVSFKSYWYV
jgi:hypothetical protein